MKWVISLYATDRGDEPVSDFILALDAPTQAKIVHLLDLLELYGPNVGMPHSKKITRDLYELRIRGKVEIRVFYAVGPKQIYLLHAFQKKSQKTPIRELSTALKRLSTL